MPAKNSSIPKLRHHKASGQAAVVLGGKWHYLGTYGTPQAEERYSRIIANWLASGRRVPDMPELSVSELVLAYWRDASVRYVHENGKPRKELATIRAALRPVKRLFGSIRVEDFGPRALIAVQRELVQSGYCRTIVNDYVRRVRRMFRWATAQELIPPSVYHGLQAVDGLRAGESEAPEPRDIKPVPQKFIDAALPHVSRQVAAMIKLQLLCGSRPAEITMLRACDIDMSGTLWEYRPPRHKTMKFGKDRVIYFGPKAQAIIREFLTADLHAYLFSPAEADRERRERLHAGRSTRVTPSELRRRRRKQPPRRKPGDHYITDSYRRAIWRACDVADAESRGAAPPFVCKRCGKGYSQFGFLRRHAEQQHGETLKLELEGERVVPRWSPNQLRHCFASAMRKEYGIEAARVLLGHASVSTTEIYAERDARLAASVIGKVG